MTNQNMNNKYILEIKQKEVKGFQKLASFDDSSSSDDDESNKIPTLSFSSNFKKQDTSKLEKAIKQDPTIYEYDSIYDKISTATCNNPKPEDKNKSQLAERFIQSAEEKEMRNQLVELKKARRENEDDKKEVLVTSSYKEKHAKLLQMEKEDRRQEELGKQDELTDQSSIAGIYSYMLDEKIQLSTKPVELAVAQEKISTPKVARFAKKNDAQSIKRAKERFLKHKVTVKKIRL